MSALFRTAALLDRLGARALVAKGVNLAYARRIPGLDCSVDAQGRWVNAQPEASVVSPIIHTTPYADYRAWVLDHWCHQATPGPGDTVIDVGAGVGEETVVFSHLVGPTGRVIAIEAHPGTFRCLEETIRRSGLTNVTALQVAVGASEGVVRMAASDNYLINSIIADAGRSDTVEVPLTTLDLLAEKLGIERVKLIKMNIEGAETDAIRGMGKLAPRIDNAIVSCHDFLSDRGDDESLRTREDCRALLEAQGFAVSQRLGHAEDWVRDNLYGLR
jgi:FkbM family methyltransferase